MLELEKQVKQAKEINEQQQADIALYEAQNKQNGGLILSKEDNSMQFGMDESEMAKNSGDAIPREPEHLKLLGHKAKITMVRFHPVYT